jgi:V-type H+-transporting ATPase subunit A
LLFSLFLLSPLPPNSTRVLQPYYEETEPDFLHYRNTAKQVLQKEDELAEIVQLVGKSSLGEGDKVTLDVARLIKEDFLQQNGISVYDRYCPFYKTVRPFLLSRLLSSPADRSPPPSPISLCRMQTGMLKCMVTYYECAVKAVEGDGSLSWARVRDATGDIYHRLQQAKFEDPADGQGAFFPFLLIACLLIRR